MDKSLESLESRKLFRLLIKDIATNGWHKSEFSEEQKNWCCGVLIKNLRPDWINSIFTAALSGCTDGVDTYKIPSNALIKYRPRVYRDETAVEKLNRTINKPKTIDLTKKVNKNQNSTTKLNMNQRITADQIGQQNLTIGQKRPIAFPDSKISTKSNHYEKFLRKTDSYPLLKNQTINAVLSAPCGVIPVPLPVFQFRPHYQDSFEMSNRILKEQQVAQEVRMEQIIRDHIEVKKGNT